MLVKLTVRTSSQRYDHPSVCYLVNYVNSQNRYIVYFTYIRRFIHTPGRQIDVKNLNWPI